MKKTLLAAISLCLATSAMAGGKGEIEGLSWQAFLGMNISKIRGNIDIGDNYPAGTNSKVGLDIGIKGEYYLPDAHGTYLSLGLEWTQKGGKQKVHIYDYFNSTDENPGGDIYDGSGTHKINEHYISIPIHVGYRHYLSDEWSIYGEAGPYLAVGVCGKNKFSSDQGDGTLVREVEHKYNYKTFNKDTYNEFASGGFQRFDCGIGFQVGAEYMDHYSLNLGFDWGLTDMLRSDYRDEYYDNSYPKYERWTSADKLKNFCFSLTLGYRF